jgi:glutamyl-tRNA reductase
VRLCVLGISHQTAALELRERLALDGDVLRQVTAGFRAKFPAAELVVLSTCNRIEWYVARPGDGSPQRDELSSFVADCCQIELAQLTDAAVYDEDRQVVEHLFRVSCGIESMVPGEPQILGQVKRAYEQATAWQCVGPTLHKLFQHALGISKQVRTETGIDTGRISIASAAVDFARRIFERFDTKTVLCIGAGEIAELTLRHLVALKPGRLWLVNRSIERAEALCAALQLSKAGGSVRAFDELDDLLVEAHIVLTSTGSTEPILTAPHVKPLLKRRGFLPLFIIDVAVPRDVASAVGDLHNVYLYNIDDLQQVVDATHAQRRQWVSKAETMLLASAEACLEELNHHDVDDVIRQLREQLHALGQVELQRTMRKLRGASDEDVQRLVEQHTSRLINQILHLPLSQLQAHQPASRLGSAASAVRRLFRLDSEAAIKPETDQL